MEVEPSSQPIALTFVDHSMLLEARESMPTLHSVQVSSASMLREAQTAPSNTLRMNEVLNELETRGDLTNQVLEADLSCEGELTFLRYEVPKPD
ncbi:MAG: hypothetical protein V4734_06435 [Terriglobus sp.]